MAQIEDLELLWLDLGEALPRCIVAFETAERFHNDPVGNLHIAALLTEECVRPLRATIRILWHARSTAPCPADERNSIFLPALHERVQAVEYQPQVVVHELVKSVVCLEVASALFNPQTQVGRIHAPPWGLVWVLHEVNGEAVRLICCGRKVGILRHGLFHRAVGTIALEWAPVCTSAKVLLHEVCCLDGICCCIGMLVCIPEGRSNSTSTTRQRC
mmetsp:Transcript_65827/g.122805  ORF Transcript_65827/g.122805 Transcript_65827/m.122805 type:complete len:216 (+) Transcript_65827:128-775(+)